MHMQPPIVIIKQASNKTSPLAGALLLIFIVAKVFMIEPVAAWSWWWVFSPVWIPMLIALGFWLLVAVVGLLIALVLGVIAYISNNSKTKRAMRDSEYL